MREIIYADVLIVINIYINYILLLLTCFKTGYRADRMRLLLASLFGGVYSLIIVIPHISDTVVAVSRPAALIIMVLIARGIVNRKLLFKFTLVFLGVNFLFAGLMLMLWYLFAPDNMYFNSGVVYFNIDAMTLLILTVAVYALIKAVGFFTKSRAPDNTVYSAEIFLLGNRYEVRAFLDTGNSLTDCFTGEGVTVVSVDCLKDIIPEEIFDDITCAPPEMKLKLIPAETLSGSRLLPVFRADRIIIRDYGKTLEADRPLIALCKERIHSGEFGAVLHPSLFTNYNREKGEINVK